MTQEEHWAPAAAAASASGATVSGAGNGVNQRVVQIPPLSGALTALWHLLLALQAEMPGQTCLIGGQLVALHGLELGVPTPRISTDADVLADVVGHQAALTRTAAFLVRRGFSPDPSAGGLIHRYAQHTASGTLVVDVLAPDHLGKRADLTTTPPGRTLQAPGGRQALARRERVRVRVDAAEGVIERPSLAAAIMIKAAALSLPGDSSRHLSDLAFLLCLVPDPRAVAVELTAKERTKLARVPVADALHPTWREFAEPQRRLGQATLRFLSRA